MIYSEKWMCVKKKKFRVFVTITFLMCTKFIKKKICININEGLLLKVINK